MKPWLETWKAYQYPIGERYRSGEYIIEGSGVTNGIPHCGTRLRAEQYGGLKEWVATTAKFAAAAPDMCRALLEGEWGGHDGDYGSHCPVCTAITSFTAPSEHNEECALDAALTKAGLPDQASRDAARKEIGI